MIIHHCLELLSHLSELEEKISRQHELFEKLPELGLSRLKREEILLRLTAQQLNRESK